MKLQLNMVGVEVLLELADAITSGKGVIISVDAGLLWNDVRYINGLHAVTVIR